MSLDSVHQLFMPDSPWKTFIHRDCELNVTTVTFFHRAVNFGYGPSVPHPHRPGNSHDRWTHVRHTSAHGPEPVVEKALNRHPAGAKEWFPHQYVGAGAAATRARPPERPGDLAAWRPGAIHTAGRTHLTGRQSDGLSRDLLPNARPRHGRLHPQVRPDHPDHVLERPAGGPDSERAREELASYLTGCTSGERRAR